MGSLKNLSEMEMTIPDYIDQPTPNPSKQQAGEGGGWSLPIKCKRGRFGAAQVASSAANSSFQIPCQNRFEALSKRYSMHDAESHTLSPRKSCTRVRFQPEMPNQKMAVLAPNQREGGPCMRTAPSLPKKGEAGMALDGDASTSSSASRRRHLAHQQSHYVMHEPSQRPRSSSSSAALEPCDTLALPLTRASPSYPAQLADPSSLGRGTPINAIQHPPTKHMKDASEAAVLGGVPPQMQKSETSQSDFSGQPERLNSLQNPEVTQTAWVGGEQNPLRALELFSGSGSVARQLAKLGYQVVTLDNNPRWNADVCQNFMKWRYKKLPRGYFQLIAASVPCNEYSCAKTRGNRKLEEADRLVKRVLEIIKYFQPQKWWIENPQTGMLKSRPFMRNYPFMDLDYCQYSDWGYKKPTRIWGSIDVVGRGAKKCNPRTCPNMETKADGRRRHRLMLGGYGPQPNTIQK